MLWNSVFPEAGQGQVADIMTLMIRESPIYLVKSVLIRVFIIESMEKVITLVVAFFDASKKVTLILNRNNKPFPTRRSCMC